MCHPEQVAHHKVGKPVSLEVMADFYMRHIKSDLMLLFISNLFRAGAMFVS